MTDVLWHTWADTYRARPKRTASPNSTAEVAAAVASAAQEGLRVRMVGSGHSFTDVAVTDGLLLSPTSLTGVRSVDPAAGTATVEAGLPLCDFNDALAAHGVALANMGDIAVQTVAGAVQTGTHGTGRDAGGLASQVVGLEIVLADGSVVECSAEREPELFHAARVGLGAFGVVTALTMAVRPAFLLHAREEPMPLDEVLERLPELRAGNDHFEFYWFPHTGNTNTKRNNITDGPARPLSRFKEWLDDDFLSNTLFEGVNRVCRRFPGAVPAVNQVSSRALSARSYTDVSHKVFTSVRDVRFVEMEYAIPAEHLVDVLREARRIVDAGDHRVSFPVEVRFAPADDVWLSTAYGRDSAYVAVHMYKGTPYEAYFADLEAVFTSVGGRPHWGKMHTRDRSYLEAVYPRLGDALAVRDRVDPLRRFGNDYLDRVFG
ncbi:D-arabinono-1,4-lactone oxidase [Nocardiopsis changdeensis]|uniref:FAD-binding protein n=1 Tax=Nocardiopsis changdeensis TaxID=2831969 RepID=A0ABX8BR68_9ACTN|nr:MULTISPECIES: D-arabinono-1,4-lactone oxidase [Nocardiopsis]QUX24720.1 FAD-binding protein [Nocardiopsis changdeensis]QYX35107.1 FAD-binding protein [Nocardiopsis sp. MT53]